MKRSLFRPSSILLYFMFSILFNGHAHNTEAFGELSEFGGDVSQYMSLLQGSSAFSFKPGTSPGTGGDSEDDAAMKGTSRRRNGETPSPVTSQGHRSKSSKRTSKPGSRSESAISDFGGDYGSYLQLLEGDSALGFNPQGDSTADNQDLQSDVFGGGGMTGKFWDMYKGSSSYDSFDEADSEMLDSARRQSPEDDQPEDEPNPTRGKREEKKHQTVIVAIKPSKAKVSKIFSEFKAALKVGDKIKMGKILDSLNLEDMLSDENETETARKIWFDKTADGEFAAKSFSIGDEGEESDDPTLVSRKRSSDDADESTKRKVVVLSKKDDSSESDEEEVQKESESRGALKNFEDFIEKMKKNTPDPIATNKGLAMSYKNLTLYGLAEMKVCGKIRKIRGMGSETWTADVCLPRLTTTIDTVTGPGVPFRGKVAGIFKEPKIKMTFREPSSTSVHILSAKVIETSGTKFVPTYDSNIPLNPWSKVSLSGYMVARVKKMLPSLVDKTILKIAHVIENMEDSK